MKPPTFIECSVCGREFGSKSIQIHEPQCLQKLRRTEIPPSDPHQSKPRRKKKFSPPFSNYGVQESNSAPLPNTQQQSFTVTMDSRKISLPKINQEGKYTKGKGDSNSRSITRPSTATLAKPKILNIDYIQYDMSLTRIDFSSSSHSPSPIQGQNIMDENHNHKTTHRLTRQNTLVIDPANRSPFILPAVSPTNSRSVLPTKLYKGVDVGPTKLPPSSNVVTTINSILGDPLKRTNAGGGICGGNDNFFSRQSGKLSIKADDKKCLPSRNFVPFSSSSFWSSGIILMNMQLQSIHNQSFIPDLPSYIPADDFHLESPVSFASPSCSVSKSISFPYLHSMSSSQCLIKNDDTLLEKIPQITPRTTSQPYQESSNVTSALAAANCESNDSKVQDQSQAQGKCCGGHSSTCDSQTHLASYLQSFQANQEEMFQIEGAALSQKQFFERMEQHGSSQEIIFLKKRDHTWSSEINCPLEGIQNNEMENQCEFHQLFMGHMRCSSSAQSISCNNNHEIPKMVEAENAVCENVSSAKEETAPVSLSYDYNYEDDFEQESQPESFRDIPSSFESLLNEETGQIILNIKEEIAMEKTDEISPMVDSIRDVTKKLPPLCSKGNNPVLRKVFQAEIDSQRKTISGTTLETNFANYLNLQGSGSEGDDEESDSGDFSAVKWTSNWSVVENKPMITSQGVCKAKDSIEHMKNIKQCEKSEKVVASGRKLWNKNIGKDLDLATDFRAMLINETSVSCANKPNVKPRIPEKQPDVKVPVVAEHKSEPKDVVVWEGSHCQHRNIAPPENETQINHLQKPAPPKSRRNSSHISKAAPNSRRNSREASSKKQNEIFLQYSKEQQAISDLASAVYRLKRLQKNKILEDYLLERPMTQGSFGYNRLGAPFTQIETISQRPRSSPSSFDTEKVLEKESRSCKTKPKINRTRKGALTCLVADSIKLLQNSILSTPRMEDNLKKANCPSRPSTPITSKPNKPKPMKDSAIKRLENIAKIYNVKPPISAIATQTPRKGERLLTPTKDRKPAKVKVTMATQTATKAMPPKSALKKSVEYGHDMSKSNSTKIPIHSSKKKVSVAEHKLNEDMKKVSEIQELSIEKRLNETKKSLEEVCGCTSKHSRRKLTVRKKTGDRNSNNQLYQIEKKGSLQNKSEHPELTIFHSEQPSKSHIIVKSDVYHAEKVMVTDDSFNSSSEFGHHEGCGERTKTFSHEFNVIADKDVDICCHIFPPSCVTENKSSHDKREDRSDTIIRLSARRIPSRSSSKTLRKKSSHKDLSNRSSHESEQKIKSYSNIELMIPQDTSSAVDEEFIDLNIVVRRKSELGVYPSLGETKSGTDDSKLLLLLDEDGQKPVSDKEVPKFLEASSSTSLKDNGAEDVSWKQRYGIDFYTATEEIPKIDDSRNNQQPLKFYGQEYSPVELKKYQSKNSNTVDIPSVDKIPKILYKRVSQVLCQNISSDALIMFDHEKQAKPSAHEVESKIKEVYEKSGLTVSEPQALRLINSQNILNEFLNDYVPKKDEQLDALVKGIATTLRFFGLLPENNQWASIFTDESEF